MSNVQWAKDIYAAFGRGDIPAVLAGFHPDIEWREAEGNPYEPSGAPWVGPQAVLELPAVCRHGATAGDHGDTVNA